MKITFTPLSEGAKAEGYAIKNAGEVILPVTERQGKLLRGDSMDVLIRKTS